MSGSTLAQLRDIRLSKAHTLRGLGISPYPSRAKRTHYVADLVAGYPGNDGQEVTIAGRLMSRRDQGGLTFAHVQDQSGQLQLFIRKNDLLPTDAATGGLGYEELKLLDLGDIVEASGTMMKTRKGELSVGVKSVRLLTKAIRPLPEKWAGLKDREQILRHRYLDTTVEPERRLPFEKVSKMLAAIRAFLNARGFNEFHTPIIQPQYGGGTAKPFMTHVNALHCDMYLAISHELYLKRLIAAGFDKVYTIGRYFRNEGIDATHHPEFSMVETMTAYENYEYNMDLVEALFKHVATDVFGKTEFSVRGNTIDIGKPWKRLSMVDAVKGAIGVDWREVKSLDEAHAHLKAIGVDEKLPSVGHALVRAFEEKVEKTLLEPTLLFGHPMDISPLAKPMDDDPRFAERFEVFIGGIECGDNWSEQNDPVKLLERWKEKYDPEAVERGDAHPLDYDFVEMLEYGMPPTTGIGPGLERMAMIFLEETNIDNVIFFPLMRPQTSEINREVFGLSHGKTRERPRELHLTREQLAELCDEGILRAQTGRIDVKPHVLTWEKATRSGAKLSSASLEIEGLLANQRVWVTGVAVKHGPDGDVADAGWVHEALSPLKKAHPSLHIEVRDAQLERDPINAGES